MIEGLNESLILGYQTISELRIEIFYDKMKVSIFAGEEIPLVKNAIKIQPLSCRMGLAEDKGYSNIGAAKF